MAKERKLNGTHSHDKYSLFYIQLFQYKTILYIVTGVVLSLLVLVFLDFSDDKLASYDI